jgi:hypothetical protein
MNNRDGDFLVYCPLQADNVPCYVTAPEIHFCPLCGRALGVDGDAHTLVEVVD